MSISMLTGIQAIRLVDRALVVVENVIFATSFIVTTILHSSKRERSDE